MQSHANNEIIPSKDEIHFFKSEPISNREFTHLPSLNRDVKNRQTPVALAIILMRLDMPISHAILVYLLLMILFNQRDLNSKVSTFLSKVPTPGFFSRKDFDIAWEQYEKLCANQSNERSAAFQEFNGFLALNGSSDEETRKAWEEKLNELEELTDSYPTFDHSNKQQTAQSIWTLIDARTKHHSKVMSLFESILNIENKTETTTMTFSKQVNC